MPISEVVEAEDLLIMVETATMFFYLSSLWCYVNIKFFHIPILQLAQVKNKNITDTLRQSRRHTVYLPLAGIVEDSLVGRDDLEAAAVDVQHRTYAYRMRSPR